MVKIIPEQGTFTGNYWCTWREQRLFMNDADIQLRKYDCNAHVIKQREQLSHEFLFGKKQGYAASYMNEVRSDMIVLLDDGWDIPYLGDYNAFGSCVLNHERFPYEGSEAERLKTLSDNCKALGYAGCGLWIPVSCYWETKEKKATQNEFLSYWEERAKWFGFADIKYVKVDWGNHWASLEYRKLMNEAFRKYAPKMYIEHTYCEGWFHDYSDKWRTEYGEKYKAVFENCDAFRCYDARFEFNNCSSLARAADMFKLGTALNDDFNHLVNVGEAPELAAALGCTMGVMSHPMLRGFAFMSAPDKFTNGIAKRTTVKSEFHNFDNYMRALRWQRVAPPFSATYGELNVSENVFEDTWAYENEPYPYYLSLDPLKNVTVTQKAPKAVSRGTELPTVKMPEIPNQRYYPEYMRKEYLPYVAASKNAKTGAYTVATLPRTIDGVMNVTIPKADVTCKGLDVNKPFAAFGCYNTLTLVFDTSIEGKALYGGDILEDEFEEIIGDGVTLCDNILTIDGELIEKLGLKCASRFDLSDPGCCFVLK